ncbi:MAG TPA: S41 family peptidase [Candidatus Dormibacteraeota bacterium]|nr:S41 family peptidase [Candidatus Dormibacteraeota bacterium]
MSRLAKFIVIALSLVIFLYVGIGYVLGRTSDDKTYRSLTVYGEVLQRVQMDYVDEPDLHLVTAGALHGLLEALDAQSGYLTPREYIDYKQKLASTKKAETGVTLSKRFGYIVVVSVLPESPAQAVGLRSGDILEAIAGFTTRDMSVGQAMNLLAGDAGSAVRVAVVRRGRAEPQDMDLVRAQIGPQRIVTQKVEPDIMALRLPTLDAGRANEIREKLVQLDKQGIHKVVLDLRDCGRGDFAEAISIARLFVSSGTIATLRGQTVSRQTFTAEPAKVVWKNPVSLLISVSTTGPAEVLAAGIAGNNRGDVVGERTFGLASEQKLIPLDDGAALILTVASYYNSSGKSIIEDGVAPTVAVRSGSDEQIDTSDGASSPNETVEPKPLSPEDPVLHKAIDLLKAPARKAA